LREAEILQVSLRLKDIDGDASFSAELIEQGGKRQVPFLVDSEKGIKMYESEDIIEYIQSYKSADKTIPPLGDLKVHKSREVCSPST
jgi:glutathione S-transferase